MDFKRLTMLGGAAACAALSSACSDVKYKQEDPVPLNYTIEFNSAGNAIWIETMTIQVANLDATKYPDDASRAQACQDILRRVKTTQPLEPDYPVLVTTPEITPCEMGATESPAGQFTVSLGPKAVVVLGKNPAAQGTEPAVQVGCGAGDVAKGTDPIRVLLEQYSSFVPLPPSPPANCPRLKTKCDNGGKCPS
jgi:hypothetical protein